MLAVRGAPVGTAQLQLMAPIDDSSTIAKFLDKRGPGIQQMAMRVSDLDTMIERLREQGMRLIYDAPGRGKLADQLHPPQGRRRRAHRAGRLSRRVHDHFRVGPRVARCAQQPVCQCRRSSAPPSVGSTGHTTRCAAPERIL